MSNTNQNAISTQAKTNHNNSQQYNANNVLNHSFDMDNATNASIATNGSTDEINDLNEDLNEDFSSNKNNNSMVVDTSFEDASLDEVLYHYNIWNNNGIDHSIVTSSVNNVDNNELYTTRGTTTNRAQVLLLQMLTKSSAPIGLYDKIMDWASDANAMGYTFPTIPQQRTTVLNHFCSQYQMHNMYPKHTNFPMEGGGVSTLTHFNFRAMLLSLLSDPRIYNNLIINWDNPNKSVHYNSSEVSDVHTGQWFKNTQQEMCIEHNHILCPLILACDRAHCDEGDKNRLSLEPMLFTLAIIPQELRTKEWAWRPLGYLNNLHLASSAEINSRPSGQNVRNTHRMLCIIFADIKAFMDQNGLEVNSLRNPISGLKQKLVFKFAIAFVIGDCKGHNMLCGCL